MKAFINDIRHSVRLLVRTPSFTIGAVATLALGIAANTAIFSIINTALLKPFGYPDPHRIVMFQNRFQQTGIGGTASPTEFNVWRRQSTAFQDVSAYDFTVANLTGLGAPEQIPVMRVSADFFQLTGANAARGRIFTGEDDQPNAMDFDDPPFIAIPVFPNRCFRHSAIYINVASDQPGEARNSP